MINVSIKRTVITGTSNCSIWLLLIGLLYNISAYSQCATPIAVTPTAPYIEDFETGPVWTTGGVENDWAWGPPTKTLINHAGSGNNCWVVGGLAINPNDGRPYYNHNEASWVESPCLDFSALAHPFIAFLMYRESEWKYDGMDLQYSLNGGTTWTVVGAATDAVDCMDANWYNRAPVTYLTSPFANIQDGWSGNIQAPVTDTGVTCGVGNGSGGWIQVKHCLPMLANQPTVLLRFGFGAGFSCNNFDGIAFDSVAISEGVDTGSFTYTCTSSSAVSFTGTSSSPCATTYAWNFGDAASGANNTGSGTNATHTFSGPGTYTVSLTVSGGPCNDPFTTTKTIDILGLATTPVNGTCTTGGSITLTVTPATGAGAYSYNWGGGITTQNRSNLSTGTYTVTVTDPDGCSNTASANITQASAPTVTATPTAASCNGQSNGSISVTVAGGTQPYTYNWGGGITTQNRTGLAAGTYTVTVTDNSGCSATASAIVSQPNAVTVSAAGGTVCSGTPATITTTVSQNGGTYSWSPGGQTTAQITVTPATTTTYTVSYTISPCTPVTATAIVNVNSNPSVSVNSAAVCTGGTATLTATANPAGGTYSWSTGATTSSISVSPTVNTGYTVTYTAPECGSVSSSATVAVANSASVTVSNDTMCTGNNATLTATPTVAGGTYSWSTGGTGPAITVSPTTNTTYSVTYTPVGCPAAQGTGTVTVEPLPMVTLSEENPGCTHGGVITATGSGGTAPYEYAINGGAYQEADSFTNLAPGNYTVTTEDTFGCVSTQQIGPIAIYTPLSVTATSANITCTTTTGQITAMATGGTSPYQYAIIGGAYQNSGSFSGLAAGNYTVTAEDAAGCTATVTETISSAATITPAVTSQPVLCFGTASGTITASASGGAAPYEYALNGGTYQNSGTFAGETAGTYTVSVRDANGCLASQSVQVTQPDSFYFVSVTATAILCPGEKNGTITVVASGGTQPYHYVATKDSVNFFTTTNGVITGLDSGSYAIQLTDNSGCTIVSSAFVPGAVPDSFTVVADSTTCNGNDGAVVVTPVVFTNAPFTYSLNNGPSQSSDSFPGLSVGSYQVVATDANGCTTTLPSVTVSQPVPPVAIAFPTDTTVRLGEQVQLDSYLSGGNISAINSYIWEPSDGLSCQACQNPVSTPYADQITYTVTITYNGNCTVNASIVVYNGTGEVYIPNAFTPNGDGNNDVFYVYGYGIKVLVLKVFDRWGEKVFESHDQLVGWDGTYKGHLQNPSVYTYEANVVFLDNTTRFLKGSVTLVR